MAQYLKAEIGEAIEQAALEVFVAEGYGGATMKRIASEAGVSTGNLYRYFEDKETLFATVLSTGFVRRFRTLLRRQVRSAWGRADGTTSERYRAASEAMLRFAIDHRLHVVFLLGRSEGTAYEGFADELARELKLLSLEHFRNLDPELELTPVLSFTLDRIYGSLVATTAEILARFADEPTIREAVAAYTTYHLNGLAALFERGAGPTQP